jgi:hypothetical protein
MFGFDILSNLKQLAVIKQYIDLNKLPDLLAAGTDLSNVDVSTMDGAKIAVQKALGLVCPFTDITVTEKDAVLCQLASKVASQDFLVGAAAVAVYAAFGRRAKGNAEPMVFDSDVQPLIEAVREFETPESDDPDVRAKSIFTNPAKIFELIQMLVTLIGMFKS